jgi:hypothetical protein
MTLLRLFAVLLCCLAASAVRAQTANTAASVDIYVFWHAGCPHCSRELEFLDRLAGERAAIRVRKFEVLHKANDDLMVAVGRALDADVSSIPFTVVGDVVFIGYLSDATTGAAIAARADECAKHGCPDTVRALVASSAAERSAQPAPGRRQGVALPDTIELPFVGPIATGTLPLPLLTVTLAALDGFNPCAMWVLVFLLGLLAGMKDRRRMWVLGGTFVAASALVYFLFLAAWLNLLLFLGALLWIRAAIGVVALAGGAYYLREFVTNRNAACKVTSRERHRKAFARLGELSRRDRLLAAAGGMVLLAFAVNLVELLCSAGIPAVFTEVLTLSQLPVWQYYAYLVLYIIVFILDDLIVLGLAPKTLEVVGATARYARYSNLVGGLALVAIGALLVLRPEWLALG